VYLNWHKHKLIRQGKEFDMKAKYIFIAVVFVWALAVSISEAQEKWLPGMLKDGYVLCQDGMGRSVVNPSAPAIAWSEVVGKSGQRVTVAKSVPAGSMPKSLESPVKEVPVNPVSADQSVAKSLATSKPPADFQQFELASRNCPNGWVPSFGKCPDEKWEPYARSAPPTAVTRTEHLGYKLDSGLGKTGIVIFSSE
jgi:hypothetical protein